MNLFEIVDESGGWKKRWPWIAGVAVVGIALAVWYFSWYGHNPRVDTAAADLASAARTSERRADAVLGDLKQKEVSARAEIHKKIDALPDDSIVDALSDLLTQSRREK